jgi:predicted ATPase/DNA-binding CsgD family transcriptional regulator
MQRIMLEGSARKRRERLWKQAPMSDAAQAPREITGKGRGQPVALRARGSGRPPENNLPLVLSSFVGREKELAEVERLLAGGIRLLTLTGPGGCGKTRLALEAAREASGRFEDGAWWVGLAPLSEPDLVPRAVASALGVREAPGRSLEEVLVEHLKARSTLLVLDNCEHLIGACAALADALLPSCPSLRILATSREALGIAGERAWLVPSLTLPDDPQRLPPVEELSRYEAVRLFVERTEAVSAGFVLEGQNAPAVARVCWRLDGIPLAIELAAARVRVLSVEQIAERLDDCFRLLTGGSRMALPRQRTLRATIDWSHDLLSEDERRLFRRLSVFAGGWTLGAAEAICAGDGIEEGEVLDLLSRLVDRSLVVARERDGEMRYRFLETVRQYGREKLEESGEAEDVRWRHALFFLELAEDAESAMLGPQQHTWMERLEVEHDNLRAALGFLLLAAKMAGVPPWGTVQEAIERGLRLAGALRRFWWARAYYTEGRAWLEEFLDLAGASGRTAERAKVLHALGVLIHRNADYPAGDHVVARSRLEESVGIYRELGDEPRTAAVLWDLGRLSNEAGDWEMARSSLEESIELERRAGNERGVALARSSLGFTFLLRGEHGPARAHVEESIRVLRRLGSPDEVKRCLLFLGHLACDRGDYAAARARFAEMMEGAVLEQNPWTAPFVLMAYAHLAAGERRAARALTLAGAADALQHTVGTSMGPAYQAYLRRDLERAWRALGEEEGAAAWEAGRAMTLEEAAAYAQDGPATPREEDTHRPPTAEAVSVRGGVPDEPHPDGLTAREAEVLGLLAEGKTNRQIAAELFLSVSTVQRHVANLYAKIGAHGRAEATAYALRRGIVRVRPERSPQ